MSTPTNVLKIQAGPLFDYSMEASSLKDSLHARLKSVCLGCFVDDAFEKVVENKEELFDIAGALCDGKDSTGLPPDLNLRIESIFRAAFALHRTFERRVLPEPWRGDIHSMLSGELNNNLDGTTASDVASDLMRIWAVCALNFGYEPALYFYDNGDSPYALMMWRGLSASGEQLIMEKADLAKPNAARKDSPYELPKDVSASLNELYQCGVEELTTSKESVFGQCHATIGEAVSQAKFQLWDEMTDNLPDLDGNCLKYTLLSDDEKVDLFTDILLTLISRKIAKGGAKK